MLCFPARATHDARCFSVGFYMAGSSEKAVPKSARWICNKTTAGVAQAQPIVGERAEPGCRIAAALQQCPPIDRRGYMFKLIQWGNHAFH